MIKTADFAQYKCEVSNVERSRFSPYARLVLNLQGEMAGRGVGWGWWGLVLLSCLCVQMDCFVGLVVKVSASGVEGLEFDSRLCGGDFSGSSHTGDLKIGTPVATLPSAWRYTVSAGTGWPADCDWVR